MPTILIVEDELSMRKLWGLFLTLEYRVVEAASVVEAVAQARLNRPDLILLDLNLHGRHDGLEVCRTLRSDPDPLLARVPILLLTEAVGEADIAAVLAAGADGYVRRPFIPSAILTLVRTYLAREE
jgi:CheY-like chemotaxis protein